MNNVYRPHVRVTIDTSIDPETGEEILSKTHQSFKAECDVNNIMKRYERDGIMDHVNEHQGDYGDYTDVQDYQTSLDQVHAAQEAFATLPGNIRGRFENDPQQFLDFVDDPANLPEMEKMGLLQTPDPQRGHLPPGPPPLPPEASPPAEPPSGASTAPPAPATPPPAT